MPFMSSKGGWLKNLCSCTHHTQLPDSLWKQTHPKSQQAAYSTNAQSQMSSKSLLSPAGSWTQHNHYTMLMSAYVGIGSALSVKCCACRV